MGSAVQVDSLGFVISQNLVESNTGFINWNVYVRKKINKAAESVDGMVDTHK